MAEKHAKIMATNQFKVIAISTYFVTSLVLPTMVIWLMAVSFDPANFLDLTVGYLRKFLKIAFFHIEPFLLFMILAIASKISDVNSIKREMGVNPIQIDNPKIVKNTPMALITSHRLTNNPGDSHLNQRLICLGVRLLPFANFPLFNISLRRACFNGLVDITDN